MLNTYVIYYFSSIVLSSEVYEIQKTPLSYTLMTVVKTLAVIINDISGTTCYIEYFLLV